MVSWLQVSPHLLRESCGQNFCQGATLQALEKYPKTFLATDSPHHTSWPPAQKIHSAYFYCPAPLSIILVPMKLEIHLNFFKIPQNRTQRLSHYAPKIKSYLPMGRTYKSMKNLKFWTVKLTPLQTPSQSIWVPEATLTFILSPLALSSTKSAIFWLTIFFFFDK